METLIDWLPRSGALLMFIIGLVGFFKPQAFTAPLQISLDSPVAVAEARTVFGGLNLGAALMALLLNQPLVYMTLGVAWLFGLLARLYSLAVDKPGLKAGMPGIVVDALLSGLFLSGLVLQ